MGKRVVEQLFPGETTPETFCAMLLQHADEIENIVAVVQWKEGHAETFNTKMNHADIAWLRWIFDQEFRPDG